MDGYWNENILPLKGKISESDHSERKQYPSDPGMTLFEKQPDEDYYWEAVRGNADFYNGGHQWGGKGRIGAAASCAWRAKTSTWEGIAWRLQERYVSEDALKVVDDIEGTFLCRDPRTKRGLISPRGPCPVMFGVRATTRDVANQATEILVQNSAPTVGSRIFLTNQATGDHIDSIRSSIVETKEILKGGHVIINGKLIAFSESGDVNKLAQWVEIGDEIDWMGLEYEYKFHLEALRITASNRNVRPLCHCGTRMKSMGANQGVRCPKCKEKSNENWTIENREPPISGWAQPPVDKRRHLAKSLS